MKSGTTTGGSCIARNLSAPAVFGPARQRLRSDLSSGQTLKIINARTATRIDADLVLLVPGASEPSKIAEALELGGGRWIHFVPTDVSALDAPARNARLDAVTASWQEAFRLRESRPAENGRAAARGLRRPQIGALRAALAHTTRSSKPATIIMPTSTGKTETMLALNPDRRFKRLLVVVPTDALRDQIAGKFETFSVFKQQHCLDASAALPWYCASPTFP
jgi:hypothetical protein